MKKYFYSDGNERKGPFSFEELKNENISKETLIWFEGLNDWTSAKYILELEDIFRLMPPPITPHDNGSISEEKISHEEPKKQTVIEPSKRINKSGLKMFTNLFSFDGRIRRTEYGLSFIISYAFAFFLGFTGVDEGTMYLLLIPVYWFVLAQGAKRCHDIGNNGWWQIIPFYVLFMFFAPGEPYRNQYGINPKI
jgi:uncharacterized membrane protein YhaH (DUF805 family)